MTQFKDKSKKSKELSNSGLLTYPILMASDILLYKTTDVPVGDDQKQHLELTHDIIKTYHHNFSTNRNKDNFKRFPYPKILTSNIKETRRIMSLKNANKKMSKSDENDKSRINLDDTEDMISKKIKAAITDSDLINYDINTINNRHELKNYASIIASLKNENNIENVINEYDGKGWADFKTYLTDTLIEHIIPIGNQIKEYKNNLNVVEDILKEGSLKTKEVAENTLKEIRYDFGMKTTK